MLKKIEQNYMFLLGMVILISFAIRFYEITSLGATYEHIRMATWLLGKGGVPTQYDPPLYNLLIALAFYIFGVHDYIAVGVSAFFGVLTIGAIYLLGREIYNEKIGIAAALFLSVTEYHIMWSRITQPYSMLAFFFVLSMLFFIRAFKDKRKASYVLFGIAWGLSSLTKYVGAFTTGAVPLLFLLYHYCVKPKNKLNLSADLTGYVLASLTVLLINVPWFLTMGTGVYMSHGYTTHFALADFSLHSAIANVLLILKLGVNEYLKMYLHIQKQNFLAAGTPWGYLYYLYALAYLVSPVILLLILKALSKFKSDSAGDVLLFIWFFFAIFFFTFVVKIADSRMIFVSIPSVILLAARGLYEIKQKHLFVAVLSLAFISGFLLSLDTLSVHHNGYRNAGLFLKENTSENDIIFHTAVTGLLLFYFEDGNWWDPDEYASAENVTIAVVDYHRTEGHGKRYLKIEEIEKDLTPIAVFKNDYYWDLAPDIKAIKDYDLIRVYRINGTGKKYAY